MIKKCIECSNDFEAKTKRAIFCTNTCAQRNARNKSKAKSSLNDVELNDKVPIPTVVNTNTETITIVPTKEEQIKKSIPTEKKKAELTDKEKALRTVMDKMNKDFGKGTARTLGEIGIEKVDAISTGSIALDRAIGVGGVPRGKITEIYGMQSSGKTTLCLHIIREAQKMGLKCLFIDVEHAFDVDYADAIGVDTENLLFIQPDSAEQALEIMDRYISSGGIGVAILDSVAALVPKSELEGEIGDAKVGLIARLMGQACRKLTGSSNRTQTACIFINQLRTDISIRYGNPNVPTGGNALKFFSSLRLDVSKTNLKDGDEMTGSRVKVKVVKNKVAPPFKVAEFDIYYGEGIDKVSELVDIAITDGVIQQGGAWLTYKEHKMQGKENFAEFLKEHEVILEEIQTIINKK